MKEIKDLLFQKKSLQAEKEKIEEDVQVNMKKLHYIRSKENLEDIKVQNTASNLMAEIRDLEEKAKEKQEKLLAKENEIKEYQKNREKLLKQERRGETTMESLEKRYLNGDIDLNNLKKQEKETLERELFISSVRSLGSSNNEPLSAYKNFRQLTINGVNNNGGNLIVPTTLYEEIISKAIEQSVIFSKISTTSIPGNMELVYDDSDIILSWQGDNQKTNVSDAIELTKITLKPKLFTIRLEISKLLMNMTAFNIENYITNKVSKKIALDIDYQIIKGVGTNSPTGILTALNDKKKELAMEYKDIVSNIRGALECPYVENAILYMNRNMLSQLDNIVDKQDRPIFQITGYGDTFNGHILDQPVILSSQIPNDVIIFGDLSAGYHMNISMDMDLIKYDTAVNGTYNNGYMFAAAMDGNVIDPNAIVVFKKKIN